AGEEAKAEQAKVQGNWRMVSLEQDGKANDSPPEALSKISFRGDRIFLDKNEVFAFRLDPSTDPKIIDFSTLDKGNKGRTFEGIYRLEGDTLTICFSTREDIRERPAGFATRGGNNLVMVTLRREP